MNTSHVAIYARVSSAPRPEAPTIASQVAALCDRVIADGLKWLHFTRQFGERETPNTGRSTE